MAANKFTVRPSVEIDGTALQPGLDEFLEQVVVDHHLHLPDMFILTFRDLDRQVLQRAKLRIGASVRIAGKALGSQAAEELIAGEVTAIEAQYDDRGARAIARGYDPSHRLHRGRRTETYKNVKDSDIVRRVVSRAGLSVGTIEDSRKTHDHVSQVNLSDWDFLKARSREIGFEIAVVGGKVEFRRPQPSSQAPQHGDYSSTNPQQLVFGQQLHAFRPRVTSAEQVKEVKVRGWDPTQKKAVIGSAPAGTTSAKLSTDPGALAKKFGDPTFVAVDRPLTTQAEVDAAAKAIAEQIGSAFAEAEGMADGQPKLRAGTPVSIGVVADDFQGQYTLTQTRHVFDQDGYRTYFTVSGRQERSLLGLASLGSSNGSVAAGGPPIHGVVVAQVTNNKDPQDLGRVKLKFPWLSDTYESDWARLAQLGAGPDSGAVFIPEVNDEVLVAFEFGDVRRPYVVGNLYNGKDKPKLGNGLIANGKVKRRGFVSRKGHRFVFFDDGSNSGIGLISSNDKLKIALNESKSEIHISCQGKITLEAQGDMSLKSQKGINVEAQGQLQLKGQSGTKIESTGMVEVTGKMIKLN